MIETIVYFIRHSEQLRVKGTFVSSDSEQVKNEKIILSVLGEKKAEKLSELDELKNIDILFSSNYVRAISTAKYIAEKNNIEINIDDKLGERKLRRFKKIRNTSDKVRKMIIQQNN